MLNYIFIIISAAVLIAVIRMLKGPTPADRIVSLDTVTTIISSLLVVLALFFKNHIYLDISFVFAALSFTGVIVIARYLEGRG
ncbi:monovalent cation/H+ antiporter complex subunit F [Halanaerobium kushneri]|jgi:multicomponent Na+:H+ antiporter subunit F|uniref:Membrane bound protein complex subunit mbxB n=1 Tax=Halanaerobium kushneri TaxID=56779 RepID=A0A1N6QNK8_9FIRM|nr:monovalent cation/H+ antiporter complex subunit F [Halanaerobium kushneri]SIQ18187.1 Membrane bound protein complex subunit mbxB [Halanaerobium kushneri]